MCSFACREEIFSNASEQPEAVASTPSAQAAVSSLLGGIPCPVFSPLDYSIGFAKLLQVQNRCSSDYFLSDLSTSGRNKYVLRLKGMNSKF